MVQTTHVKNKVTLVLIGTLLLKMKNFLPTKIIKYGKCSKISNTLKLGTPKTIAENNF